MTDIWKEIYGFEGLYEISSTGKVRSYKGRVPKILKERKDAYGYVKYSLSKDGRVYERLAHRLVAIAFVSNPHDLPVVNHINEIKTDNRMENLEWTTIGQNVTYGTALERRKRLATLKYGIEIHVWNDVEDYIFPSLSECSRQLNINTSQLYDVMLGVVSTAKGYYIERLDGSTQQLQLHRKAGKTIVATNLDTEVETTYISVREAARSVNGKQSNISACANGKQNTAYGYSWRYA